MKPVFRTAIVILVACFVFPLGGQPAARATAGEPPPRATCILTHVAYAGKCTEMPAIPRDSTPRQVCESILACLNNVACTKTYCLATTIRQGWKLESAEWKRESAE